MTLTGKDHLPSLAPLVILTSASILMFLAAEALRRWDLVIDLTDLTDDG